MRQTYLSWCAFALAGLLATGNVHAFGLGGSLGFGAESWDYETNYQEDRTLGHVSFVLDTHLSQSRLFNYRFTLGQETSEADNNGLTMSGVMMTHSFGFRIVGRDRFRLWVGPQLKVTTYDTLEDDTSNDYDGVVLGIGFGPVVGFNLNFGKVVTLSFTGGLRATSYYVDYDVYSGTGSYQGYSDLDADATGSFLDVSLIFRIGEHGY